MTTQKGSRLGSIGKLSDFGKASQPKPTEPSEPSPIAVEPKPTPKKTSPRSTKKQRVEKPATINIKIRGDQRLWLSDMARQVRENNQEPVPPDERVYPQHLIGVAIQLLQHSEIDWDQVKNIEDIQERLNL